jgi:hypothetical protein
MFTAIQNIQFYIYLGTKQLVLLLLFKMFAHTHTLLFSLTDFYSFFIAGIKSNLGSLTFAYSKFAGIYYCCATSQSRDQATCRTINSRQWKRWDFFPFATASRPALGASQPPAQWVPGALLLWVKRPGREADHSPPSSAEVKFV